ncbi:MAG: hypothetical protein WC314_25455 [Vulcanimicrobiota bacterium]
MKITSTNPSTVALSTTKRPEKNTTGEATRSQSSSTIFLRSTPPRPLQLAEGAVAEFARGQSGPPELVVKDSTGQVVLRSQVLPNTVQAGPEGELVFADGKNVTRWDPSTGQSRTFPYSVGRHQSANLEGLIALDRGRTLIVGKGSAISPNLLSIHGPDGELHKSIDLNQGPNQVKLDDLFLTPDRQRLYVSAHYSPSFGEGVGHAVYRVNLNNGHKKRLFFAPSDTLYEGKALVTEKEEILVARGEQITRRGSNGRSKGHYYSLGALRRDLGALTKPLPNVPMYSSSPVSRTSLNEYLEDLSIQAGWSGGEVAVEDGYYRYSAHRLNPSGETPLFQQAGPPVSRFRPASKSVLGGGLGLLAGAAAGFATGGSWGGALLGAASAAALGGAVGATYAYVSHNDEVARAKVEGEELVTGRAQLLESLKAEVGFTGVQPESHRLADVYRGEGASLVDFPQSGMIAVFGSDEYSLYDADGTLLRQGEGNPVFEQGKLQLGETVYDLNQGSVVSGDWLQIAEGRVTKALVGAASEQVAYRGDGRFQATGGKTREIPLEPEALGFPLALAPVADAAQVFEEKRTLFESTPAFAAVTETKKFSTDQVDPYHWVADPEVTLLSTEVEAKLSDGSILTGNDRSFKYGEHSSSGSVKVTEAGLVVTENLWGEATYTTQKRGILSMLTGGALSGTKSHTKEATVGRVEQTIHPEGSVKVQRFTPRKHAHPDNPLIPADRHEILPDGTIRSQGADASEVTPDGTLVVERVHASFDYYIPEEQKNIKLPVPPPLE